jgi:peptide/nickel transport system ATP-binding protein
MSDAADPTTDATDVETTGEQPLVAVRDLEKYFFEQDSLYDKLLGADPVAVQAVDGVSFDIQSGETLGLVGESGCGKSTTGETLLRLQEATDGVVEFDGENVFEMGEAALQEFRRRAQVVFQDPYSSLDPRMTIEDIVRQPLDVHDVGTRKERRERVVELIERVGLSADQLERYPSEFSGGQRQRVGIARALALDPDFLVLDEPTSALDVSVQAQVLNLLEELQADLGLTYLLISHDLSVIRHVCDRVAVMYLGEIVEIGPADDLFASPKHPYTEALLESVPRATVAESDREVDPLAGDIPSPRDPPSGCRFRTRCPEVIPPDDVGLSQSVFRAVMDLRGRIERREITREVLAEDETADDRPDADLATVLSERLLDVELPGDHRRYVETAFEQVADGEFEAAAAHLRERYESVCEREAPALDDDGHPVACHLYGEND